MTLFHGLRLQQDVSRETIEALSYLEESVRRWNPKINLVSKISAQDVMTRHIVDSLQVVKMLPPVSDHLADFGSGAGFPGLVVAIYAKQIGCPKRVTLIESDARKCIFLREMVRELQLDAEVINNRIETIGCLCADVVSARALAPLIQLCGYAHQHMQDSGTALFLKGEHYLSEVREAQRAWQFQLSIMPSVTNPKAAILALKDIRHA